MDLKGLFFEYTEGEFLRSFESLRELEVYLAFIYTLPLPPQGLTFALGIFSKSSIQHLLAEEAALLIPTFIRENLILSISAHIKSINDVGICQQVVS